MKKIFTLLTTFVLAIAAYAANTESTGQEVWWGYVNTDNSESSVGTQTAETYYCAIFIPGNHAVAGGKTIHAVRFGLLAPSAENAKVWVASSLPASITTASTLALENVPNSQLGSENIEVELTTPIEIPAGGVYVGYTFTIGKTDTTQDRYPALTAGTDAPNALLLKTDQMDWGDFNGYGFGSLFLKVKLSGEFADNSATATAIETAYAGLGESGSTVVTVMNGGATPISSIDYTITTDGVASAEQHVDLTTPIEFNSTGTITISVPADATIGKSTKTLNITKVNGNENANAEMGTDFILYTLPELVDRNVVVEEFTGTGCGWCPRGLVGMEKLRQTFGDRFVGIGIHQYNGSDAMYIATNAYANLGFSGAPSCRIDRGAEIDPYYGSNEDICIDFAKEMNIPATAKVNVSATIDEELKTVNAKAEVEALLDDSNYKLEFVVIGDGLTGTGSAWNQANYYYQYTAEQAEADELLAEFCRGGKNGKSSVTGWSFNDVALVSSYVGGINKAPDLGTLAAGEKKEAEYSLTMPTKATLKNAVANAELYIVALVTDGANGTIVNAAKQKITVADPSGIENVDTATNSEQVTHYTLDGRRVQNMQKGLNIVRMANGKTIKVVSK